MKEDCRIIDPCITSQASSTRRIAHKKVSTDKEAHTRSHEVRHCDPERDKDTRHIAAAAEYT